MTDLLNKVKFTRLPEYFQKAVGFETYNRLQYFKEYQDLLDFTEADNLEFAARAKAPKIGKKITQKGGRVITCDPAKTYPCGNVCRGQDKPCKNPIEGQAKTYIEFLKLQPKTNSKTPLDKSDKTLDTGKDKPVKQGETGMSSWDRKQEKVQEFAKTTLEAIQKTSEFKELKNLMSGYKNRDGSLKNSDPEWVLRFPHFDVNNDKVGKRVNELQKQLQSKFNLHPIGDSNSFNRFTWEKTFDSSTEVKGTQGVIPKPDTTTTKPKKEVATTAAKETKTEPKKPLAEYGLKGKVTELSKENETQELEDFINSTSKNHQTIYIGKDGSTSDAPKVIRAKDANPKNDKKLTKKQESEEFRFIASTNEINVYSGTAYVKTPDGKFYKQEKGSKTLKPVTADEIREKGFGVEIKQTKGDTDKTAPEKETKPAASTSSEERSRSAKKQKVTKVGSYELTDDDIALLPWRTKQLLDTKSGRDELGKNKELLNLVKEISSSGDQELIDKYKKSGVNKSTFNDTYSKVRDDIYASKRKRGIETDIDRQIRQAKELEELERQDDLKRKNAAKQAKEESIKRAKASGAAPLDKDNLEKGESLSSTQSKKEFLEQYRDNYVKTADRKSVV